MDKGRRTDVHQIQILVQDVMVIQVYLRVQPVLFLDFLRLSGDNIHKRGNTAPLRKLKIGLDVGVGDSPGPDDGDVNHILYPPGGFFHAVITDPGSL